MTVEEIGQRMTARELAEWRAYYELEPFGDVRDDFRTGVIATIIANLTRGKHDKPMNPTDFMIHQDSKSERSSADRRESQEAMIAALKGMKPIGD